MIKGELGDVDEDMVRSLSMITELSRTKSVESAIFLDNDFVESKRKMDF